MSDASISEFPHVSPMIRTFGGDPYSSRSTNSGEDPRNMKSAVDGHVFLNPFLQDGATNSANVTHSDYFYSGCEHCESDSTRRVPNRTTVHLRNTK